MISKFKYNDDAAYTYAPGFSMKGDDGDPGKQGIHGSNMYFIDYDLDNSYSIELTLQKLDNNQILTNNVTSVLEREYQSNDLIYSNSGKVYKIINATNTIHKFNVKLLGYIEDSRLELVNVSATYESAEQSICIPSSRSTKMTDQINNSAGEWITKMYGVKVIYTISNFDTDYEYSLKLYIDNNKIFQEYFRAGSVENIDKDVADPIYKEYYDDLVFNFKHIIEIKLNALETNIDTTYYFYDQCMDRIKTQGNNIKCVINNTKNASYQGADISGTNAAQNALNTMFDGNLEVEPVGNTHKYVQTSYTNLSNDKNVDSITSSIYNKYAGNSMFISKWNISDASDLIINILNDAETFLEVTNKNSGKTFYKKIKIQYSEANG